MKIDKIVVSYLDTNCYIVSKGNKCLIIDPGWDFDKIVEKIALKKVVGILITHFHHDHIGALEEIKDKYQVEVFSSRTKEKNINIDKFNFEIIDTKGHTDDSVTFYFKEENVMFTGDFLFKETIGRTDLGGSNSKMYDSLNKIKQYKDDTIIYPGHGLSTILGNEKKNNIFLR